MDILEFMSKAAFSVQKWDFCFRFWGTVAEFPHTHLITSTGTTNEVYAEASLKMDHWVFEP